MYAKYNSFNRLDVPIFTLCYPGATYNDGVLTNVIGNIPLTCDEELSINFNSLSELSLRAYSMKNNVISDVFKKINSKALIFVEGFGFFQITECDTNYSDELDYKDITAESCESELQNKTIPYIEDNTYLFSDLLQTLVEQVPLWTIGSIDDSVMNKYRYFEDVDTDNNILSFMLEDMQDAYECLFLFDIINRQINVYDQNNYVRQTDIHLSRESLIQSLNITYNSDDLYTSLRVSGDDDIYISPINPLGGNVLYDFSYYLSWMSNGLGDKVSEWQDLVESYSKAPDTVCLKEDGYPESPEENETVFFSDTQELYQYTSSGWTQIDLFYYCWNLLYYQYLEQKSNSTAEISKLEMQIDLYKRCRDNIVAESGMPAEQLGYSVDGTSVVQITNLVNNYSTYIVSNGGDSIPIKRSYIDTLQVSSNSATLTYAAVGDSGKEITALYVKGADGIYVRQLEQVSSTSELELEKFVYTSSTKTLSFYSGELADGTEIAVFYSQEESTSVKSKEVILITDLLESVDGLMAVAESSKTAQEALLTEIQSKINDVLVHITSIRDEVSMSKYFTAEELEELANYVFEGSYSDDYVVITDIMDYTEQFAQMKELYDRAKSQLKRVCTPTEEFDIDVESFVFTNIFSDWTDELESGCLINVETEEGYIAQLFLSNFTVNYDDKKFTMTFGNRYNRFDSKALFEDTLGQISKTSNTLDYVKEAIYPIKTGDQLNKIQKELDASRTLTAGAALASTDNKIVIDESGYTGRRLVDDGEYDPEQIKIVNNQIVLTDDAWKSCKLAVGKITVDDDKSIYGVNAEVLMGDLILGNSLRIVDEDGTDIFAVDGKIDKKITAAANEIHAVTTTTGFTFNADGLTIQDTSNGSIKNVIDETGMRVIYINSTTGADGSGATSTNMLTATIDGVEATNLHATTYLTVGGHARFENYNDGTDDKRVGCFYI